MPSNNYKPYLVKLMRFVNNEHYAIDHDFSNEDLAALKPRDIVRYMNLTAYGLVDPPRNARPTHARSNTLQYMKKAISHYMPMQNMTWNPLGGPDGEGIGNPTRSKEVNSLIKRVKRAEVRRQGAQSKARRSITKPEFETSQTILMASQDPCVKYGIPSVMKFQFHMIARLDDTCQFVKENLQSVSDWDFILKAKLRWSKNVMEERDCPFQMLMGANDTFYCVLLALAVWLEVSLGMAGAALNPYVFAINDDVSIPEGGDKTKSWIQDYMRDNVFSQQELQTSGLLGSHSNRKYASSHARKNGCSKDEKDYRARWKTSTRTSDVYDDVELPYIDAKVASRLCVGGPVKYVLKEGSGVTNQFLFDYVVPNIHSHFSPQVARVLGTSLLWLIFSTKSDYVPQEIVDRVKEAYNGVGTLPADENPVQKVLLVVTGDDAELFIDEVGVISDSTPGAGAAAAPGMRRRERDHFLALEAQVGALRRDLAEVKENQAQIQAEMRRLHQITNANLRRIAIQPVARPARVNPRVEGQGEVGNVTRGAGGAPDMPGILSPTPRTLYILWDEYEKGIGGRKPAKLFTREERGRVKHKYCRRKVFWDVVSGLVRGGLTAQVAIDRVYQVYGFDKSVTNVINAMKQDKRNGTVHAILRV